MTGDELRAARKRLGLTQAKLAALLGISDGRAVRRWESGRRDIPAPIVVLLTAILTSKGVRSYFGLKLTP